jgi:hypothetical protein
VEATKYEDPAAEPPVRSGHKAATLKTADTDADKKEAGTL